MFTHCCISQERHKVRKIWFDIRIALEILFHFELSYTFAISTPWPLKIALEMTNIPKMTILAKNELGICPFFVSREIGKYKPLLYGSTHNLSLNVPQYVRSWSDHYVRRYWSICGRDWRKIWKTAFFSCYLIKFRMIKGAYQLNLLIRGKWW